MNDTEHLRRAEQAKAIIEAPVWIEAWATYDEKLISIIRGSKRGEVEIREQAKALLDAAVAARAHLTDLMQNGKVVAETIRIDAQMKKRKA